MTRLTSWKVGGPTDPSIEIDAAVKVETADHKFRDTMVALEGPSGHHRLSEIDLGGSNTRIVFSSTVAGR